MKDRTTIKSNKNSRRTAWLGGGRHFRQICGLLLTVAMLLSLCPVSLAADVRIINKDISDDENDQLMVLGPVHANDKYVLGFAYDIDWTVKVTLNSTDNKNFATTTSNILFGEDFSYWAIKMPEFDNKVDNVLYTTVLDDEYDGDFIEMEIGKTDNYSKYFILRNFETENKEGTSLNTFLLADEYTVLSESRAGQFKNIVADKTKSGSLLSELVDNGFIDKSYLGYDDNEKNDSSTVNKYFEAKTAEYFETEDENIGFLCIFMEEGKKPDETTDGGSNRPSGTGSGPGGGPVGGPSQKEPEGAGDGEAPEDADVKPGPSKPTTLPAALLPRFAQAFLDGFIPLAAFTPDHIAYLYGYEEGDVQPDAYIPRAQAAALIFRILSATDKNDPLDNLFEFEDWEWYAQAVAYLTKNEIILGYDDGTFRPDGNITRAEFVTMICRFDMSEGPLVLEFSDIAGHWAEEYIAIGATNGWIAGYGDGTFRPDGNITRAEVVSLINRLLYRGIELADIPGWAPEFTDLNSSHWAYPDIMEAATNHEFERKTNGYELWTASYSVV